MEITHPLRRWRLGQTPPITQEAVAVRVGVKKPAVSRWENFNRRPTLTQAAKISELTGIPIEEFARTKQAAQ